MISFLGKSKPAYLAALIEICLNPHADKVNYLLIDRGIQNDDLSAEQYRVLPLLHKSKIELFSKCSRKKIQSAYKHTLYRNHILLNRAVKFEKMISNSGLGSCIFLKGVAQSLRSTNRIGSRPMADIDVLISKIDTQAEDFIKILKAEKYQIIDTSIRSITLLSREGFQFDVHWLLSEWAISQRVVDCVAKSSKTIAFNNHSYTIPCVEHHLTHVIGHGLLNPAIAFDARWVIDALSIVQDSPDLDPVKIIEFSNLLNSRSRIKLGYQMIADEAPKCLMFNREMFGYIADSIIPDGTISVWLFNQPPCAARELSMEKISRTTYIKNIWIAYLYAPYILWKTNGRPLNYALSLCCGFPAPKINIAIALFARKLLVRLLFIVFNVRPK